MKDKSVNTATGTLVAPNLVLTSSHSILKYGESAESFIFVPGCQNKR